MSSPERLDRAAARTAASAQTIGQMCAALSIAARLSPASGSELLGPLETVRDDLRGAVVDLVAVGAVLPRREGAPSVDVLTELVKVEAIRGEALALLDALRRALPLAETLDEAHGRSCWADDLGDLIGKLEIQTSGPIGSGRE